MREALLSPSEKKNKPQNTTNANVPTPKKKRKEGNKEMERADHAQTFSDLSELPAELAEEVRFNVRSNIFRICPCYSYL